jgi:molybdate transport system substrate-binding protein
LPAAIQRLTVYFAGVTTYAKDPEAARALINYFVSPDGIEAIAESGLEPIASR